MIDDSGWRPTAASTRCPLLSALIDPQVRAWGVAVGRLTRLDPELQWDATLARDVLRSAQASAFFPSGAFLRVDDGLTVRHSISDRRLAFEVDLFGAPFLECRATVGEQGDIAVAVTRSGRLSDGPVLPEGVLLIDLESLLIDGLVLLKAAATTVGYRGMYDLTVDAVCDIPGRPPLLRANARSTGALLRPPAGFAGFEPVTLTMYSHELAWSGHKLVWDAALSMARQFGVDTPQLVPDPAQGTPDLFGAVGH